MVKTRKAGRGRKPKPSEHAQRLQRMRERPPKPVPVLLDPWTDSSDFAEALHLHMRRHADSSHTLWRAIVRDGDTLDPATLASWRAGKTSPRRSDSFVFLARIEERYALPDGYFESKLPHRARATARPVTNRLSRAEQRRLSWHLPNDFERRPRGEQDAILTWVNEQIISGATDYRRYQAGAMRHRYAIRFPNIQRPSPDAEEVDPLSMAADPELRTGPLAAPAGLSTEMERLLQFKTSTLAPTGYVRRGVWGPETASQKVEHLGLMFGALAASPGGAVKGHGAPISDLCIGLLAFPQIWDWYVEWRERRRGFYTAWEIDMLSVANALTAPETGWLTQTPDVATSLRPIADLVTTSDIDAAVENWPALCAETHAHTLRRAKEIQRVARVHRDPFEPILPVLEAASPLAEYRKITQEIVRLMPRRRLYPKAAAECLRSLLMLRLGLHLGLRQKNLRQLLVRRRGEGASTERQLEDRLCGEMRWSDRHGGWEVLIPAKAFKNAHSSFFAGKPFRLVLPDLDQLYQYIDTYLTGDRALLLGNARDPGTFFVKSVKRSSSDASYNQTTFYEAWRLTIQRFGIYNPYTNRGAIRGLLPHGPHNVRDVLATHILKLTGSFEQASYAIQDTPEIVAKHYGRFLPENKASLAAQVLNQVWEQE